MKILQGDALAQLRTLPACYIDAIVTDPPYELGFMGKAWDNTGVANSVDMWRECLRVLKPGGHLLSFGGSRTYHRMACAIEDAGFEIRDQIMWLYGSGFPKSLDVSKAVDKAAGVEREVIGVNVNGSGPHQIKLDNHGAGDTGIGYMDGSGKVFDVTAPATDAAKQWDGWGTALKPAHEPIVVARKPLEGTVAANVLRWGTGALNIDGCRVGNGDDRTAGGRSGDKASSVLEDGFHGERQVRPTGGRWPANLIHDGSEEALVGFPDSKGQQGDVRGDEPSGVTKDIYGKFAGRVPAPARNDSGSAARFFYCAKTSKAERELGCENIALTPLAYGNQAQAEVKRGNTEHTGKSGINTVKMRGNNHPTVKPSALMRYLCRLVTPPGGVVLDPFTGSGSTGLAAIREGFDFIGIELSTDYVKIAEARILAEMLS